MPAAERPVINLSCFYKHEFQLLGKEEPKNIWFPDSSLDNRSPPFPEPLAPDLSGSAALCGS